MVRLRTSIAPLALFLALASAEAHAKRGDKDQCEKKGSKPQVFIKANTPLYRGPGINYPVAGFLERARCAPFSEVSMDRQWVLVDLGEKLAWVERGTLAASSQELIAKSGAGDGPSPVGSGQSRTFAEATQQVALMERPAQSGEAKSILPPGTRFLPLAVTKSGKWIQVRDERSEIGWIQAKHVKGAALSDLPVADDMVGESDTIELAEDPAPPVIEEQISAPLGPKEDAGVNAIAAVMGAALAPIHSLDSNSPNGYRTYDLSAFSGGAAIEVGINDLGPVALRIAYQFAMLSGISPEGGSNVAVSGFQHDAQLRIGLPLAAGAFLITPELGYSFGLFDFAFGLPGTPAQFLSTTSHTGMAGARFQLFATRSLLVDLDGAYQFGVTAEGPFRLGKAGFTMGAIAGLGAQLLITDLISIVARYHVNYRRTPYKGEAPFDNSITQATLTDLSHGLLAGVAFTIGG